jgi:hypothetical protein
MSVGPHPEGEQPGASARARAEAARVRAGARLRHAIGDLSLPDDARLDDRARAAVRSALAGLVAAAEADVRRNAARLLIARGATLTAERLIGGTPVLDRLAEAELLHDPKLMAELIVRVELDLLGDALTPVASGPESTGSLVRLAGSPDDQVAAASAALLGAETRRRDDPVGDGLPAELHHRLLWLVAAAVREQLADDVEVIDLDRALTEATLRSLASHDEGDRPEAAAIRLAQAMNADLDELAPLLLDAVADRRLTLLVALVARASGIKFEQVRELVVDPKGDTFFLVLRAAGVDRTTIARIAVAFAEADPRRDLERTADAIDRAALLFPDEARTAIADLALNRDFRAAVAALKGAR